MNTAEAREYSRNCQILHKNTDAVEANGYSRSRRIQQKPPHQAEASEYSRSHEYSRRPHTEQKPPQLIMTTLHLDNDEANKESFFGEPDADGFRWFKTGDARLRGRPG